MQPSIGTYDGLGGPPRISKKTCRRQNSILVFRQQLMLLSSQQFCVTNYMLRLNVAPGFVPEAPALGSTKLAKEPNRKHCLFVRPEISLQLPLSQGG